MKNHIIATKIVKSTRPRKLPHGLKRFHLRGLPKLMRSMRRD